MALQGSLFPGSRGWLRRRLSPESQERSQYRDFIAAAGWQVGELTPQGEETAQAVCSLLHRAARGMRLHVRSWMDDGKVYFYVVQDGHPGA